MPCITIWKTTKADVVVSDVDSVPPDAVTGVRTTVFFDADYKVSEITRHAEEVLDLNSTKVFNLPVKVGENFSPALIQKLNADGHTNSW